MYEALVATIKEVYPDVHYDNLRFVFQPYVIIPVVISIFFLKNYLQLGRIDLKKPSSQFDKLKTDSFVDFD